MLPEQFFRNYYAARETSERLRFETFEYPMLERDILENVRLVQRMDGYTSIVHPFSFHYYPVLCWPTTLTGDDWRRAWAEAQDRATDAALDAIY